MSEGEHTKKQLEHDLDTARQDFDELRGNIERVVLYLDSLPEEPAFEAIRIRVKTLLNIGEPLVLREEDQREIFVVAVEAGWETEETEEPDLPLKEWGMTMEEKFNNMTMEDSEGLRRMAARENMTGDDV